MAPAAPDRRAADERADRSEDALWAGHLAVLRQALLMRKPDARDRIRSERTRLEREIAALGDRRALAQRSLRWSGEDANRAEDALSAQLDAQITQRLRRVSDLAALLRGKPAPRGSEDRGATPEAALRPAMVDPVEMLLGKGRLSEDQARAAREIAWIYEAMGKAGRARVSRMSQIDPPAGWQDMPLPERAALLHAKRFLPWAEGLRCDCPVALDIVLRVAVLGLSPYAVSRHHRLGWKSCIDRLAWGLDRYWRPARRIPSLRDGGATQPPREDLQGHNPCVAADGKSTAGAAGQR